MRFVNNIKEAFASEGSSDRGSLVETVLLIAGFAVVTILVVSWIGSAIAGQAANVSNCISSANGGDVSVSRDNCTNDTFNVKTQVHNKINAEKGSRF